MNRTRRCCLFGVCLSLGSCQRTACCEGYLGSEGCTRTLIETIPIDSSSYGFAPYDALFADGVAAGQLSWHASWVGPRGPIDLVFDPVLPTAAVEVYDNVPNSEVGVLDEWCPPTMFRIERTGTLTDGEGHECRAAGSTVLTAAGSPRSSLDCIWPDARSVWNRYAPTVERTIPPSGLVEPMLFRVHFEHDTGEGSGAVSIRYQTDPGSVVWDSVYNDATFHPGPATPSP